MTANTPPSVSPEWNLITEGVALDLTYHSLGNRGGGIRHQYRLPMTEVKELADDMLEAYMLSHRWEKVELYAAEVQHLDEMIVCGRLIAIDSVLTGSHDRTILQSNDAEELVISSSLLIDVWRRIE